MFDVCVDCGCGIWGDDVAVPAVPVLCECCEPYHETGGES